MAKAGENYIGVYCPVCGKGLREAFLGSRRLVECIRGHLWHLLVSEAGSLSFERVERSKAMPSEPTYFSEQGEI